MTTPLIGTRIKTARERREMSQDELARLFGFKDRQTVSAIETGERRVSAEELVRAVEVLGQPLEFFTDPFRLEGEGRFSWRQTGAGPQRLDAYERSAGRWVAAFRVIAPQVGEPPPLLRRALGLARTSSYEEAMAAGERFAAEFDLGPVPAARLVEAMERRLNILVLMVDALQGISGAACRLPELDAVLINRNEVPGRRHFDLAHELFHILTWDAMPPEHVEEAAEISKNRVEQLANNFASALLMPTAVLERFGDWTAIVEADLPARLTEAAEALEVTASALKWRLVALGWMKPGMAKALTDVVLRRHRRMAAAPEPAPPLFSRPFMEVLSRALDQGRVSARRAAGLVDLSVDDLAALFRAHGLDAPFEP